MKIAMLARNAELYTHKRLKAAAEERGHTLDIINTLRCYMNIASHRIGLRFIITGKSWSGMMLSFRASGRRSHSMARLYYVSSRCRACTR